MPVPAMFPCASTITAPTCGFGDARPMPSRARSSARRRNCSSVDIANQYLPRRHRGTEENNRDEFLLPAWWKAAVGIVFDLGNGCAAAASRPSPQGSHRIRVWVRWRRRGFPAQNATRQILEAFHQRLFVLAVHHGPPSRKLLFEHFYSNNESTNSCGAKGNRSPAFSPTPTKRTGRPSSREMATTTPPLAVPSSLVSTMPVTPAAWVNRRACCK